MINNEVIENQFDEYVVATYLEIAHIFNCSLRTIQRKLAHWDTIRSYDFNGRYISLRRLAYFNEYGIWVYNNIHFSQYGDLKQTFIGVVSNSTMGLNASEIKHILGVDTRSFLAHYKEHSRIRREKLAGTYVYFSSQKEVFNRQIAKRRQNLEALSAAPLQAPTAIAVLVTAIKHPDFTLEELADHLSKEGLRVKPQTLNAFFTYYGIKKKGSH